MKSHWFRADASFPLPKIPLPWAASIMLLFVLPLTFYLGKWNLPLWVCFIVWAEYFVLGANVDTWKSILPSLPFGAGIGALWCASAVLVTGWVASVVGSEHASYVAFALTNLVWVTLVVYGCGWHPRLQEGTLAVFNGFTLQLAIYFTGALPAFGPMDNPYYVVFWSFIWTVLMCYLGWFLGWLNVFLTFPQAPLKQTSSL